MPIPKRLIDHWVNQLGVNNPEGGLLTHTEKEVMRLGVRQFLIWAEENGYVLIKPEKK